MGAGNLIAAVVVVGAIVGTYALARTLDHIDEAIDAWGDQPVIHDEMKAAAKLCGERAGGSDLQVDQEAIARSHKEADNGLST